MALGNGAMMLFSLECVTLSSPGTAELAQSITIICSPDLSADLQIGHIKLKCYQRPVGQFNPAAIGP